MFWTAFTWGLGVSCGACFGLLLFIIIKAGWDWLMNTRAAQAIQEYNDKVLELMSDRNKFAETMTAHLSVISKALSGQKTTVASVSSCLASLGATDGEIKFLLDCDLPEFEYEVETWCETNLDDLRRTQ